MGFIKKTALPIAAVILLCVVTGLLAEPKLYRAARAAVGLTGPEEMDQNWSFSVSHHKRLDRSVRSSDILLVGDSHIQGMNTTLLGLNTVNFGIGGDTSYGILNRISQYASVDRVKAVVLAFGLNDLNYRSTDSFARNVKTIFDRVSAPVVLSAVLPVDERRIRDRSVYTNEDINALNVVLSKACKKDCTFAEVPADLIGPNGNLRLHEGDGIHLSPAGYTVWANALRKALIGTSNAKENEPADSVRAFWQSCLPRTEHPPADGFYRVRSIGGTPATTEAITKLILSGDKTGTFTSPWMYEGDRSITPVVGGYSVLTDSKGAPAAVLKTTLLMTLPFNQITENETAIDGPAVRPLDVWKPIHVTFFTNELTARGKTFVEDMPVTVEQFQVVCAR